MQPKKAYLLLPGTGALVIVTSHDSVTDLALLSKLKSKGINKFIAFEIPVDLVRAKYGGHFDVVVENLAKNSDLRVLDFDGSRAFALFSFEELGTPIYYQAK
jgi:hypothetical protein